MLGSRRACSSAVNSSHTSSSACSTSEGTLASIDGGDGGAAGTVRLTEGGGAAA